MKKDSLVYHRSGRKGKIEVVPSKPCRTQKDLTLAYSPGVAYPVLEISKNSETAYEYTSKGNLVAVVSNGSAILGLGNLGALAAKPVMEGKGILFKRFADIDVFDLEIDTADPEEIVRACELLEPTFGGINLEDIKAPECFLVERELKKSLSIPVFHDDQHGTAIISGAALMNALDITGKSIRSAIIVVNGAGAAGIACAKFAVLLGAKRQNIIMCDSKGVIYRGRKDGMNEEKEKFAQPTSMRRLSEALKGADVFYGNSVGNVLDEKMLKSMAAKPVVFAMANPVPEIDYNRAKSARKDIIMATGRSDFPNQVNNVMGFPFIFRGALDTRSKDINEDMKLAAAFSLSKLARLPVTEEVKQAYGGKNFSYGPDYILPKPFDSRILVEEALATAAAAIDSGVAGKILEPAAYRKQLLKLGKEIGKRYNRI